ncbi:hypothetical protein O7626_22300 [Micromonospora sp. WMMD1102]|uniref:hypothetical protein n=1 Tax=Micromonospora sp. WMMD1102 TaxID=3016105 RepID=UPI0024152DAB|nr:hypothetical protein [Micromonospora sp. WMMD1102]MDG4788620.1 hypothetical protein [Micromonospora sp. WMMD1102]
MTEDSAARHDPRPGSTRAADPARWPAVRLVEPAAAGFVFVGIASGRWRRPVALPNARRRQLLAQVEEVATVLRGRSDVSRADTFRGLVRPPGTRALPGQRVPAAEYDVVLLVELGSVAAAAGLLSGTPVRELVGTARRSHGNVLAFAASNVRRIGPVDHDRQGVFLFNYFTADRVTENLAAWQYTAGWFQAETGLDNSTVLAPVDGSGVGFTLVNHCRWSRLTEILPSLVLKPSFRSYVLATFARHRTAPHPVLYRLHRS